MKDREIKVAICVLGGCLLVFYGAISYALEIFPYRIVMPPVVAAKAVGELLSIEEYSNDSRWVADVPEKTGMFLKKPGEYESRYTLYVSTNDTTARLLNEDGETLHQWSLSFNKIWPDAAQVNSLFPLDDSYFYLRDFHLYPNGDLLLMVSAGGVTPWGMGLVKLDKDSQVLWKYTGYVNNDFDVAPDGSIYVIEHEIREDKPEKVDEIFLPFLEDNIVHLDPDGQEIDRFSLLDALGQSDYAALLKRIVDDGKGDPTHTNSVRYILDDHPEVSWLKKGYLLLSIRNIDAFAVVDPAEKKVVYAAGMPTRHQHDIELRADGNFMVFDNRGDVHGDDYTRVLAFKPDTQEAVWQHDLDAQGGQMHSKFWGQDQQLSNGNVFIVYAEKGQMFEVNERGETVWAYNTPLYKLIDGTKRVATITSAARIPMDYIAFDLK